MHLPFSNIPHSFCTSGLCYRNYLYIYYNLLGPSHRVLIIYGPSHRDYYIHRGTLEPCAWWG